MLPVSWEKINDGWFNYVKGHNPYKYFGIYDVVRFDTFWLTSKGRPRSAPVSLTRTRAGSSLGTVYYVGTAGHVSAETIRQYIESQEQRYAQ